MDLREIIKTDLKKISNHLPDGAHTILNQVSKQLNDYESRVKTFVQDMDLKSRDARVRSRKHLDQLVTQIRKTRINLESRISEVVNSEGKRLNEKVNEVLKRLVLTAKAEKKAKTASRSKTKATTTKKRTTRKAKAAR